MSITRRRLLTLSATMAAAGFTSPLWLRHGQLFGVEDAYAAPAGKKLLVMFLAGGNDGLNTVIPYAHSDYYAKRPQDLAYAPSEVIRLHDSREVGLHPNLKNLKTLYDRRQVAIVQGVGYDKPDLSHFGSTDIWESGDPEHARLGTGWLGRYLDLAPDNGSVVRAVSVGDYLPQALVGETRSGIVVPSLGGFTFYDGGEGDQSSAAYRLHQSFMKCVEAHPQDKVADALLGADRAAVSAIRSISSLGRPDDPAPSTLADQVAVAVTLLSSQLGVDVAFVTLGSFDDHASEKAPHAELIKQVDDAIGRFNTEVAKTANPSDYLLLTFSEFGRRVEENGTTGTDHGTAAPLFVVGGGVAGGLYGSQPRLDDASLDADGNLVRSVEFREVYSTILDRWLTGPGSKEVLGLKGTEGLHPINFLR